jgi:hypothetical protein
VAQDPSSHVTQKFEQGMQRELMRHEIATRLWVGPMVITQVIWKSGTIKERRHMSSSRRLKCSRNQSWPSDSGQTQPLIQMDHFMVSGIEHHESRGARTPDM